jgi:lipoate-protein ligase B
MDLNVIDLGLIEYGAAWKLQDDYAAQVAAGTRPPTLLLLEHPHVYTFGRKGHKDNLLWDQAQLDEHGISVHWVDRGGDVTYHGPGQLVGYPLLPLGPQQPVGQVGEHSEVETHIPRADYVGYVRRLEKVLIASLGHIGLAAGQRPGKTGVWIQADVYSRCPRCKPQDRKKPAKIAAIGVKVDARGVSRHGFALNVDPDMTYWEGIVACGLQDEPVVSLEDLLYPVPSMSRVKQVVASEFAQQFGFQIT